MEQSSEEENEGQNTFLDESDDDLIDEIKKFPEPTTARQIQSFLGLTVYFCKFISSYSIIAKPSSDMTLKSNILFEFGDDQRNTFITLKSRLSS